MPAAKLNRLGRRVLYLQYTNPAALPPLEHSSRILADVGWDVSFLGIHALGDADRLRFPCHPRISVRRIPFCRPGWRQKIHYLGFALWSLGVTLWWRPTFIYASDALICPVALLVGLVPGVSLLYHEHDSPSGPATTSFGRLCLWARRQVARHARICVLPNAERVTFFRSETGREHLIFCVRNFPRSEEVVPPREPSSAPGLRLYYHGTLVPSRLPLAIIEALSRVSAGVNLTVVGYETIGAPGYIGKLRNAARRLGVLDRVRIVPAMPRHELLRLCAEQDVGLALMPMQSEDVNMKEMVGASNKAFDYLACGVALLVSDLPSWNRAYVDSGLGRACDPDDPADIARSLVWFLDHPLEFNAMAGRGRQRLLAEWTYEREFAPVRDLMNAQVQ